MAARGRAVTPYKVGHLDFAAEAPVHVEVPFSPDLTALANKLPADIGIGISTKKPTERGSNDEECLLMLALSTVPVNRTDIVRCFRILTQRSKAAVTTKVHEMVTDIEELLKK